MVGLETALPVSQKALIDTGLIGWEDLVRVLSYTPANIGQVTGHGLPLAIGNPAELTLYDPTVSRVWHATDLSGKSVNSPYLGSSLPGRTIATFHGGYATVSDGQVLDSELVAEAALKAAQR